MAKIIKIEPLASWVEVAGISLGGCIATGRKIRAKGHAHNYHPARGYADNEYGQMKKKAQDWICVSNRKRLGITIPSDGVMFDETLLTPYKTAIHEYAHILTPNTGHGKEWKKKMRELGQSVKRRYM